MVTGMGSGWSDYKSGLTVVGIVKGNGVRLKWVGRLKQTGLKFRLDLH